MKTINFLTSHFLPENTACTNRVLSFIEALESSYKVNVICLTEKGQLQKETKSTISENIDVYYINQKIFDGKNFFKRALYEVIYISKLIKRSKQLPSDLVIVTAPYMFMIPLVGFGVKGLKILDIRDLVWEYLNETNFLAKIIKKALTLIMKYGIRKFVRITVTNDYEADILTNHYIKEEPVVIPNGIDIKRYKRLVTIESEKDEQFTVTYVGNIGLAQNLTVLLESAKELSNIKFYIIGDGIEFVKLRDYAKEHDLDNVIFTGKLSWENLEHYYEKTSVLYAQLDEKYISAMPSKLYEYASIGLPIIYGGVGQAKIFVNKLSNAIAILPNDSAALTAAILQMQNITPNISTENRLLIKENYLRENLAKDMVQIINHLTNKSPI